MNHTITKALAEVAPGEDDGEGPFGSFNILLSAQTRDRDGDELMQKEWLPLPEWIPIDVDHGMSVTTTVGSGTPSFDENGNVRVRGTFASTPLAQEVRTLIKEKHVRFVSVAFRNVKSLQKDGGPFRELLNGGFVNTPANTGAVILESKALDTRAEALATKAALSAGGGGDAALVQAAHDAMVHLGAVCIQMVPDEDPTGTSDGANKSLNGTMSDLTDGIAFRNAKGESLTFASHDEARTFFADMIKSIDDANAADETLVEVGEADEKSAETEEAKTLASLTLEDFKSAILETLKSQESKDEAPAEAAAASEEDPAPADEAAAKSVDVTPEDRARDMFLRLAKF